MPYFDTASSLQMYSRSRGKGAAAVFVHPPPLDGTVWLDQIETQADIRQCYAVDLLGHGLSDPNPSQTYKPSDHAKDLSAWIAAVPKGPIDLVGLGVGGVVAALAYAAEPKRFRSLTLISTTFTGTEPEEEAAMHKEFARMSVVEERQVVFHRITEDDMSPDASLLSRARYRSMMHRTPVESLVHVLLGNANEPHTGLPAKLNLPVLAISTKARDYSGELGAVKGLEKAVIGDDGVMPPLEDPAEVSAALRRFWLKVTPPMSVELATPARSA